MSKLYTEPFAMVPEWLLDTRVSDRAIRLFAVLNRHANEKGRAFPGRRTLAEKLRCSLDSVDRATQELLDAAALVKSPRFRTTGDRGQTANDYHLWPLRRGGRTDAAGLASPVRPQERESVERESVVEPFVATLPRRRTRFPDDFSIAAEMVEWLQARHPSLDLVEQTALFSDHHRAKGTTMLDWRLAWKNWMRNAARFQAGGRTRQTVAERNRSELAEYDRRVALRQANGEI